MHFEEKGLNTRITEVEMNPLDRRQAQNDIILVLRTIFGNIFYVVHTLELYTFAKSSCINNFADIVVSFVLALITGSC